MTSEGSARSVRYSYFLWQGDGPASPSTTAEMPLPSVSLLPYRAASLARRLWPGKHSCRGPVVHTPPVFVHRYLQLREDSCHLLALRYSNTSTQFTDFVFDTSRWQRH